VNIGVLASHEGTTLQAVLDACADEKFGAKVSVVISNNSESGALRRARAAGVSGYHLSSKTHPNPTELDRAICAALGSAAVDVILLAGYMKKLGPRALLAYAGRILNTHPALLPKFGGSGMYGMRVHRAVLAAGDRISGATLHLVEAEYDTGPIVAQCSVAVAEDDTPETLAERVQTAERALIVEVLHDIACGVRSLPLRTGA
jgi:phosphoribosylglycinamide formyltransferase-1